jgi:hypothetical protein
MQQSWLSARVAEIANLLQTNDRKQHLLMLTVGALATGVLWWIYFTRPDVFTGFSEGRVNVGWLLIVAVPPFVMVFGFGSLICSKPRQGKVSGPMKGYLDQQESDRKWKVMIAAGVAAAANLLLMLVMTGID